MQINSADYYIDLIKKIQNVSSDYAVGKLINIPSNRMVMFRNGTVTLDTIVAIDVAKYAEVDVTEVIFHAKAFKANKLGDDTAATRWLELVEAA